MDRPLAAGGPMTPAGGGGAPRASRYIPSALLATAMVMVAALLPTALRPPQQPPNASAELSPDAPPDDKQESIVAALQRGTSATAGAGGGEGPGSGTAPNGAPGLPPPAVPPDPPPLFCPGGFGDPLRQAESVYSAPCAPAWAGDNGGATYKNVTGDEVRVAVYLSLANARNEGPIPTTQPDDENGAERTFRVFQQYFNERYQFWGRYMRFVQIRNGPTDRNWSSEESRAAAIRADDQYHAFLGVHPFHAFGAEFARRGLPSWGISFAEEDYRNNAPYLWSIYPDVTKEARFGAELVCKKLRDKPARFAGPPIDTRTRAIGVVANYEENRRYRSSHFRDAYQEECGGHVEESVDFNGHTDQNAMATAITRLQAAGVTSVVLATELDPAIQLMTQADSQGYFPEWLFFHGYGSLQHNLIARTMPPTQMEHAFGFSPWEVPRPGPQTECVRAYKTIDPDNNPDGFWCHLAFIQMVQIANAIQMAGPNLNPTTLKEGLYRMGLTDPVEPWAIDGGYGPGDHTWVDTQTEIWWDNGASAWRYVRGGRRYALGEQLTEDPLFFSDGVLQG